MTHIVVAGAGIGGLATALALAAAGLRVTIIERRATLAEYGAGLQLSPNATRILRSLELLDAVRRCSLEPLAVRVRRARDAAELIRFPLGAYAEARYGAPFLLTLRPDLQRVLAEAVEVNPSITIHFGCDLLEADAISADRVSLETSLGRMEADGLVDGRGVATANPDASGRESWRALVPSDRVPDQATRPESNLWLGPRTHLVHYPVPGRALVNVVAIIKSDRQASAERDLWSRPGDPAVLRRAFAGWHTDVLSLLDPAAEWRRWPLLQALRRPNWSRGRVTVIGDAAHPMMPFLAQGASQAIEDAAALGEVFRSTADVSAGFASYERKRRMRAERVQAASERQGEIYHLTRPASDARDLAMRLLGGARGLKRLDWLYSA